MARNREDKILSIELVFNILLVISIIATGFFYVLCSDKGVFHIKRILLNKSNRMLRIGFGKNKGNWFIRIDLWFLGLRFTGPKEKLSFKERSCDNSVTREVPDFHFKGVRNPHDGRMEFMYVSGPPPVEKDEGTLYIVRVLRYGYFVWVAGHLPIVTPMDTDCQCQYQKDKVIPFPY